VRIINRIGSKVSCRSLFKKMRFLTAPCIYAQSCINLVVDRYNELRGNNNRASHRFKHDIKLTNCKRKFAEKNPYYMGIRLFNRLPEHIKCEVYKKDKIKKLVKELLLDEEFYSVQEFLDYK